MRFGFVEPALPDELLWIRLSAPWVLAIVIPSCGHYRIALLTQLGVGVPVYRWLYLDTDDRLKVT